MSIGGTIMRQSRFYMPFCLLLLAACSNDEMVSDEMNNHGSKITAVGSLPEATNTRMTFQERDNGSSKELVIKWGGEIPESIGVTNGTKQWVFDQTDFSGGATTTANFAPSEDISASVGDWFYAVYPADFLGSVTNANLGLNFGFGKSGPEFKAILYAKAQLEEGNKLNFKFDYLTSVLKIKLKTFSDADPIAPYLTPTTSYSLAQTVFKLRASEGLYQTAKLNMNDGTLSDKVPVTELPLHSVDFVYDSDAQTTTCSDVYQSFFPETIKDFKVCFDLVDGVYEAKITNQWTFNKGFFYYTDDLVPTKVGFIIAKTDLVDSETAQTISLETILDRITSRDSSCGNSERKVLYVRDLNGSCPFYVGSNNRVLSTSFEAAEWQESDKYMEPSYTTKASILGNWLRTKAISVELVDMSQSGITNISARMFYGCSNIDPSTIGNSALKQLILPSGVAVIKSDAFANSGIQHLLLPCDNSSTLVTVDTAFGSKSDMTDVNIYLPYLTTQADAETICGKFTVGDSRPNVYYNFTGSSEEDYFNTAKYTKL